MPIHDAISELKYDWLIVVNVGSILCIFMNRRFTNNILYVVQGCYNVCTNSRHANPHISDLVVNKWTIESVRLRGEGCYLTKRFQGRIFLEIDQQEKIIAYGGRVY